MKVRPSPPARRGFLMVMALVVLIIVAVLAGAFAVGLVNARKRAVIAARHAQAVLLAESGEARARAKLARSSDYEGETWSVAASELGGIEGAEVIIRVEKVEARARARRVFVRAEFPVGATARARSSRQAEVETGPRPEGVQP